MIESDRMVAFNLKHGQKSKGVNKALLKSQITHWVLRPTHTKASCITIRYECIVVNSKLLKSRHCKTVHCFLGFLAMLFSNCYVQILIEHPCTLIQELALT